MARKKKQQEVEKSTISNSTISYSGKITVTLKNGNKTLSKQIYKNNGGLLLWQFLCLSMSGKYAEAELIRPARIVLYYCKNNTVPNNINALDDEDQFAILTGEVPINRASEVLPVRDNGRTINYTATLHFLVPPAYFNTTSPDDAINTIILYGKNRPTNITAENKKNYSAYYFFANESNPTQWDTEHILKIKDLKENYNIIIDWELSVDNK